MLTLRRLRDYCLYLVYEQTFHSSICMNTKFCVDEAETCWELGLEWAK